jgi:hypothetical protein
MLKFCIAILGSLNSQGRFSGNFDSADFCIFEVFALVYNGVASFANLFLQFIAMLKTLLY